ncbi:MAG: polyphenol oxidase family protein [Acidimicrobiia bacterium]
MIRPPELEGVAFSEASEGDLRHDLRARTALSLELAIGPAWATVHQVHGSGVVRVEEPGQTGEADALWTTVSRLPIAVFTADCFGVVLIAEGAVGAAHCGWPGASEDVVGHLRAVMVAAGYAPRQAVLGPGIGPCCFEVGPEVAQLFPDEQATTSWGTTSVNLPAVIARQLDGVEISDVRRCTYHEPGWFSHRRNRDPERLAALGWLP